MNDVLLAAALAPYLWFAWRDNVLHFRARKVAWPEHVTHVGVLAGLVVGIAAVFQRDPERALLGAALFLPPALLDELVFHRGIPAEEHDVHAKQHLLLFAFAVAGALVMWKERA